MWEERNILHLESREETAEVKWLVSETIADYPAAHLTNHIHIIIHTWYDEICQFYPDPSVTHGKDCVEDGLQMAATHLHMDIVAE